LARESGWRGADDPVKTTELIAGSSVVLLAALSAHAQGNFQNLNFEAANIPSGTQVASFVPISEGLPGWSAYFTTGSTTDPQTQVGFDFISTGGNIISVVDKNAPMPQLQGKYSALLCGGGNEILYSSSISQSGLVPAGTQSLLFDAAVYGAPFIVTLGGQTINMVPLQTFANYTEYGGEIPSSFADHGETLSFTEPPEPEGEPQPSFLELDNIVFSPTSVVPEPNMLGLTAVGGLLFGARKWFARR